MKKPTFYRDWVKLLSFFFILSSTPGWGQDFQECTVGVAVGKATPDGRPLLWKNRDSSNRNNAVSYFTDGDYPYIGVVNSGDTQIWAGVNAMGFAIMNSESLDLEGDSLDGEGWFMKLALKTCATVDEFEGLLMATNGPGRSTKANFGVIDATGAGAIFETGNHTYFKFDAADPGYLVRANFAHTGDGTGYGHDRQGRADSLFAQALENENLTYQYILRTVARNLASQGTNPYPLPFKGCLKDRSTGFIETQNTINRHRTVSCSVFHGVKPGEPATLTTMWVILGEPICGVAVPLWVGSGGVPPEMNGKKDAPFNTAIQQLESLAYPDTSLPRFLNTFVLKNSLGGGILSFTFPLEDRIFQLTETKLTIWRKYPPTPAVSKDFEYNLIQSAYQSFLNRQGHLGFVD